MKLKDITLSKLPVTIPGKNRKKWVLENIKKLKELSINIFRLLNLTGFTRSEFIIENNTPYLLDINTVPGLTSESILPKQLFAANISLESFFNDILKEALNKNN